MNVHYIIIYNWTIIILILDLCFIVNCLFSIYLVFYSLSVCQADNRLCSFIMIIIIIIINHNCE